MKRFSCAVITGASSGIGLEFARILAKRSDRLVLVARRRNLLDQISTEIADPNCQIHCLQSDLEVPDASYVLLKEVEALGLVPDLWINNAGFGLYGESLSLPAERELAMVDLNIKALLALTRGSASAMVRKSGGTILNIGSVASFQPGPGMATYFATKSFVLSYSQAMDVELSGDGVRVLCLCPGNTSTAFHTVAGTSRSKWMHKVAAMGAKRVAEIGIAQIDQGKRVQVAGFLNFWMVFSVRLLPMTLVAWISSKILRSN